MSVGTPEAFAGAPRLKPITALVDSKATAHTNPVRVIRFIRFSNFVRWKLHLAADGQLYVRLNLLSV
jgi:hypothetical protein